MCRRSRNAPGRRFYLLLSSDSDLDLIDDFVRQARFRADVWRAARS
jgi:hypothetical protein